MLDTLISPIASPDTPEWYAARSTGIGSSEAAAACGVSSYSTPLEVYARKVGQLDEKQDNDAMRLGRLLEPIVAQEFARRSGIGIAQYPVGMLRSADLPCMLATPDAVLESGELLECKTTSGWRAKSLGEQGSDAIPDEWLCQAQQQLHVAGLAVCHIAVLIDGRNLWTGRVERNELVIDQMKEAEGELWERIEQRDPPPALWTHPSTPRLVRELHTLVSDKVIELPEEIAKLWAQQKEIRDTIRSLTEEADSIKARVLDVIGDAGAAILPGGLRKIVRRQIGESDVAYTRKAYIDVREVKT